jgi:hypothetical protein
VCHAQNKFEREYRIKKSEFPENAYAFISLELTGVKRLRFYKEVDSAKISYEAKFKKDNLFYSIEFDKEGLLEDVEIVITEVDIPNETFANITAFLDRKYPLYKIKKMQQQYPFTETTDIKSTLKNAFQNLILPSVNYELIVSAKTEEGRDDFEILFNKEGNFVSLRKLLPPNYDHILY